MDHQPAAAAGSDTNVKGDDFEVFFLCEGCQRPESVAERLASFIRSAQKTLDICIYTFKLCDNLRDIVAGALNDRAAAGVKIRIAYDAGTQQEKLNVQGASGYEPCDESTAAFIRSLGFESKPIEGERALMHDKYVIVDAGTPGAAVWTGSMNFSDDSWELQENNVLIFRSEEMAQLYTNDFNELWVDGNIASTGTMDSGEVTLQYGGEPAYILVNFSPGEGDWMDELIANQVDRTQEQATLAFVVMTSTRILQAFERLMERGVPVEGIYDETQMEGVKYQWTQVPANHWKPGTFERIVEYGHLVGKNTTPYTPESKHDFMHNKVMVLDNTVITGSFNFSRHAQGNAENLLVITSAPLAAQYRDYIHSIMEKYRDSPPPPRHKPVEPNPDVIG